NKINKNKKVVIHCRMGIGRASVLAAATMINLGYEAKDIFEIIGKYRKLEVPDTDEQKTWILSIEDKLEKKGKTLCNNIHTSILSKSLARRIYKNVHQSKANVRRCRRRLSIPSTQPRGTSQLLIFTFSETPKIVARMLLPHPASFFWWGRVDASITKAVSSLRPYSAMANVSVLLTLTSPLFL
ncbi:MAG: hypothetical protein WBA17_09120, partial [Saprospiraceae bacterium]